jgi:HEAT repeat protein
MAAVALLGVGACSPRGDDLRRALESYEPAQRVCAVKAVAGLGDAAYVPALVDRLDDEDVAVRLAAIVALEQLTGERFRYDAWSSVEQRRLAVNAWRAYVAFQAESAGRPQTSQPADSAN